MDILSSPAFVITYAVVQTLILLLLIRLLDLYEHEPLPAVAAMALWGAIGATALSATGNQIVHDALPRDTEFVFGSAISAPVVEELAKAIALIVAFAVAAWASRRYGTKPLRGLTDGLVYGAAVGIGFAFTEDLHFLVVTAAREGLERGFEIFELRRDFFGIGMLRHAIFTAAMGAGLGIALWTRSRLLKIVAPVVGLVLAITLHAANNGLTKLMLVLRHGFDTTVDYLDRAVPLATERAMAATEDSAALVAALVDYATFIAFAAAVWWWLSFQRKVIATELEPEIDSGLIDKRDLELVPRFWQRLKWYWELIRVGEIERARLARRLHIELANLALLKWRVRRSGIGRDEMERSRNRVANLKAATRVDVYAPTST